MRQRAVIADVPLIGIFRAAGITDIMDSDSLAKPNNRQKSQSKASKMLVSKRYAICNGAT
jgi:hypothetical protein